MRHRTDPIPMRFGAFELMKKGAARYDLRDPYHIAVTLSWPRFFLVLLALELAINLVFALLYLVGPASIANARPGSFTDAFFFSIETLATVGYGVMAPANLYGHVVSDLVRPGLHRDHDRAHLRALLKAAGEDPVRG